jgi:hypothetical protein
MKFDDHDPDEQEADLNYPSNPQRIPPRRTQQNNAQTNFGAPVPPLPLHATNLNTIQHQKLSGRLSQTQPITIDEELLSPIVNFYKNQTNYDCMPMSCKVMVFDIDLPIREAFTIAARNGILLKSISNNFRYFFRNSLGQYKEFLGWNVNSDRFN